MKTKTKPNSNFPIVHPYLPAEIDPATGRVTVYLGECSCGGRFAAEVSYEEYREMKLPSWGICTWCGGV